MRQIPSCYRQPKVAQYPKLDGKGRCAFAEAPIATGEVVVVFGGTVLHGSQLGGLSPNERHAVVQIEEELYLWSVVTGPGDWVNHSCDPNTGLVGQIVLVALRDIRRGEELTYDYAMTDGSTYDEFECHCATPLCRGRVTGDDWQRPELVARYGDHFSPYLLRRMQARDARASEHAKSVRGMSASC